MRRSTQTLAALLLALAAAAPAQAETAVRWLSQSQTNSAQYPIETATMEAIDALEGLDLTVQRSEFQALGLELSDALRLTRAGTFDIVSAQVGQVARDDAFLEGIDLIGVSTDMASLEEAVDAYRDAFNARLEERFGVRALAIWPFGPQIFLCNQEITTLDDLEGLKVRSFTASMSTLLERLGATPVTLSFPEVYPALQRGVASCGITSATSSNTGKWPEVTTHLMPLSVSGSVQAHLVNLDWWNGLPEASQTALADASQTMETELWALANSVNDEAIACSTGQPTCKGAPHTAYDMTLVEVSPDDIDRVKAIAAEVVVGDWAERCEQTYEGCTQVWNDTIGAARGITVQ
jgi:TRAP-type C4-dicarboxylate transport system substrate-binding protein